MAGAAFRRILSSYSPEMLVSQSEFAAASELVIAGPINLYGWILRTANIATPQLFFYDGTTGIIQPGDLTPSISIGQYALAPAFLPIANDLGISKTGVDLISYTIFYTRL